MCGHVSIFSRHEPVSEAQLQAGLTALHHRGPDGQRAWFSPDRRVGLGHTRLSIIDLEGGAQPLHTPDGTVHAVVNGELYDFEHLRAELQAAGHRFSTLSDSEVLLHLYQRHGTACLAHLRGEFSFTLWDAANEVIFAGRDRFGIKPLYYSRVGDRLVVGSEVKALFAAGVPAAWDEEQVVQMHTCMVAAPSRSLFKGVHQVPPGHFLLASRHDLKVLPYWDFDYPRLDAPPPPATEAEHIEAVRETLHDAVRVRLRADVPVSCYLSGGLDSCAVLGIAQRYASQPLQAYTIAFVDDRQSEYNEEPIAREMAAHAGARYTPIEVTTRSLVDRFADSVWHAENVIINLHATAKFVLSEAVRAAGHKVVLTGEGSDEIFAGYASFRKDHLLSRHTGVAAQDALRALVAKNNASAGILLSEGDATLPTLERTLGFTPAFLEPFAAQATGLRRLLSRDILARYAHRDGYRVLLNEVDVHRQLQGRDPVHQAMYLWSKTQLNNYILTCLGDRMEMAHSVEGRTPMLDHLLVERVVRTPVDLKIKGTTEKHLLREAARPVLTARVYGRQKHPFLAPPAPQRATDPLDTLLNDTLRSAAAGSLPFYDRSALTALLNARARDEASTRAASEPTLIAALSFALMQERFALS
jgi:asparagine synthase (glutamine-hydrolysing)